MSVADAGCFLGVAVSSAVVLTTRTSGMHTNTLAGMHSTTRVHTNVVDNTSVLNLELAKATEARWPITQQ